MRRILLAVAGLVVASVVGVVAWFAVDEATTRDEVAPNVTYDGFGLRRAPLDAVPGIVDARANEIESSPVFIATPESTLETTAGELGLRVDRDATIETIGEAGRTGGFFDRFWSWLRAPWEPRAVETDLAWPEDELVQRISELDGALVRLPVEPSVEVTADGVDVFAGVEGIEIDPPGTAQTILDAWEPARPLTVEASVDTIPPQQSDSDAVALGERIESLTAGGMTVRVLDSTGRLAEATLREAMTVDGTLAEPEISFRRDLLQEALLELFETVSRPGEDPVFDIVDGEPVVVEEGSAPQGCCSPDAGSVIADALLSESAEPVELPPAPIGDAALEAWARGEGIEDVVGEFTTEHQCCQSRVENIHRIADIIRGQYLLPGESFSVNGFVGERTVEKGFVGAGVIEQGRFTEDVGGGISQFATTFFNAAFFGGLDIDEYQSHSIYISRYPYGREATLSFPKPDLVVTNTTEYPVLIWPTYTDTSITVSLYSTPHIEVEQTGQEEGPARSCTQVETFRERTYPDGTVVEDSFIALYRPAEGLDCDGNPTPEP